MSIPSYAVRLLYVLYNFKNLTYHVNVCAHMHACACEWGCQGTYMEVRGQLVELPLPFQHMGSRVKLSVIRLNLTHHSLKFFIDFFFIISVVQALKLYY